MKEVMAGNDGDEIDTSKRLTGVVKNYEYRRGFGYIIPSGGTEDNKVFAHWKQIESADTWPALKEGLTVEYHLGKHTSGQRAGQEFASKITLPGGAKVSVGAEAKGRKILDNNSRHQGTVKYWNQERGFGWIEFPNDIVVGGETVPSKDDVYVPIDEIQTDDSPPGLKVGLTVEFLIYKGKGGYGAANVTAPGGGKISVPWDDRSFGWNQKRGYNSAWGSSASKRPRYRISVTAGQAVVRLQIDSAHMSPLIGVGGMNAHLMQQQTGCRFDFSDSWSPGPQCLALVGNDQQLQTAVKLVAQELAKKAESSEIKAIFLVPFAVHNRVAGSSGMGVLRIKGDTNCKVEMAEAAVEVVGHGIFKQLAVAGTPGQIEGPLHQAVKQLAISYDPKLDGYGNAEWKASSDYLRNAAGKGKVDAEMDDGETW